MIKKLLQDKGISLAAAWSFNQLSYAIIYPFIPIYLCNVRGMEYSTVSIIFPLLGIASIIAPIPFGVLTDRYGYNFMMLFGQACRGILFFLLAFLVYINASFWAIAFLLMLNTAVGVAFQIGSDAYLFDITTLEERPSYYSKIRIGFNIGWALGPMLGAFFADIPFWLFFVITGILCMGGTAYTHYICGSGAARKKNGSERKRLAVPINTRGVFKNRKFLMLVTGTFFLMMLASQLYSTLSIYSKDTVKISTQELGMIYSLNGFMVLVLQIPLVALIGKFKMRVVNQLMLGSLLYMLGYMPLGCAYNAVFIACAVAVITCGEIIIQPALYTAVSSHTDNKNAGRMFSVNSLMRGIGYAIGPWIGGQLFEKCNSITLWVVLSMFACISAAFFINGCQYRRY